MFTDIDTFEDRRRRPLTHPTIAGSVGLSGRNDPDDTAMIERLLHATGELDPAETEGPTGYWGLRTDTALKRFQKARGLATDGLVTPRGPTLKALEAKADANARARVPAGPAPESRSLLAARDAPPLAASQKRRHSDLAEMSGARGIRPEDRSKERQVAMAQILAVPALAGLSATEAAALLSALGLTGLAALFVTDQARNATAPRDGNRSGGVRDNGLTGETVDRFEAVDPEFEKQLKTPGFEVAEGFDENPPAEEVPTFPDRTVLVPPTIPKILPDFTYDEYLLDLLTRPMENSRGKPDTRKGNDWLAEDLREIADTGYPWFEGILHHIKGAHKDGKGKYLEEEVVYAPGRKGKRLGSSRPDITHVVGKDPEDKTAPRIRVNSVSTLADGETLTAWEAKSLSRLLNNVGHQLVYTIKKYDSTKQTETEYREYLRKEIKKILDDAERNLSEILKARAQ